MNSILFEYPVQASFGKKLSKSKIYENAKINSTLQKKFETQVEKMVWSYKLSSDTINLPARPEAPEIQIFSIDQKLPELSNDILYCIDQAIPYPIFYELSFEDNIKFKAAYKRTSEADVSKWVVTDYFETEWQSNKTERIKLPISIDLSGLYEQMLRLLLPSQPKTGETLRAHVERIHLIRNKQVEYQKLEIRMQKEPQFNRKVELNSQLHHMQQEIDLLMLN